MGSTATEIDFAMCWRALERRDAAFVGSFVYGVVTTGIFCLPSCPSRLPLRQNVRFFPTVDAAMTAGFRACRRCNPLDHSPNSSLRNVVSLCRYIERNIDQPLSLETLAAECGLSSYQVHRIFKTFIGLTPRAYTEQVRLGVLKNKLSSARTVTDAIFDAGFQSLSVVYGRVLTRLGMTPKQYSEGGSGVTVSFGIGETSLGRVLIGATDRGVCFLEFGDSTSDLLETLSREYPQASMIPMPDDSRTQFQEWMYALDEHISGSREELNLPLDIRGTAFQRKVWDFLCSIPYGAVISYSEVADAIGASGSARAVAQACAANRIGVLVPCHRVIRGDGTLGGYRWGVDRKKALLDAEGQQDLEPYNYRTNVD